ncbi:MAG: hypothetical protein WCQ53_00960 [bacterium]
MYVLSILFLITGVLFSGADNTGTVVGGASSITTDIVNMNKNKLLQQEALIEARTELTKLGISPEKCGTWRQDRNSFYDWVNNKTGSAAPTADTGNCVNPTVGTADWKTFLSTSGGWAAKITTSCKITPSSTTAGPVNQVTIIDWASVSTAVNNCKAAYSKEATTCKYSDCKKTVDAAKDAAKTPVESNCGKCKAYVQSGTSWLEYLGLGTDLATLLKQLTGKDKTDDTKTTLSCEQQCSKYLGDAAGYLACRCAATQTLADGVTTQRCALETECTADTSCKGKRDTMEKAGYCTGTDCDDIEQSCACTEIAGVTGAATNRWDPAKRVCVKDADGSGDNALAYKADNPKYNTDNTAADAAKTDAASPTGAGAAAAGAAAGATPSTQTAAKTAADSKDKAKFASLSKHAAGQFAASSAQNAGGGEYNADAAAAGGDSSSAKKPEDIIEAKGPDIWKIVHDIYQTGIDANRFMDYKSAVVEDKSAVKKGKKKVKGKNA